MQNTHSGREGGSAVPEKTPAAETVAVIVPAYNVEGYVFRAIESVLAQTHRTLELILVDDGSTDGTWDVIRRYAEADPRIKAIRQENSGVSRARNTGLDAMEAELFLFLDSDDWLEEDAITYLLSLRAQYPEALVSACCYDVWPTADGGFEKQPVEAPGKLAVTDAHEALLHVGNSHFHLQSACYKLFDARRLGGLRFREDIHHGEDGLFVYEALLRSSALVFSTEPKWDILSRPGSASRTPYNAKWLTAITAAEEMLSRAPDGELADVLMLNVIRRAKLVEKHALLSGGDAADVRRAREVFWKYRAAFLSRKRPARAHLGYLLYAGLPAPLLRPVLRLQDAALARQTARPKKRGAGTEDQKAGERT